jgi:hypothetical protein
MQAGCEKYAVTVQTILRFPDHHLRAAAQRVVVFDELVAANGVRTYVNPHIVCASADMIRHGVEKVEESRSTRS